MPPVRGTRLPAMHGEPAPRSVAGDCNLFFGLFPPPRVREAMARAVEQLRATTPVRARWSDPRRYHVTVQFLGRHAQTDPATLAPLLAAAGTVDAPGFDLQLDTTGTFGRGRVGWLGCAAASPGLHVLWQALGAALDAQSVDRDRAAAYTPHVTVLRQARDAWPTRAIEAIGWPVDAFVLARSPREGGQPYEVLHRWPLRPA